MHRSFLAVALSPIIVAALLSLSSSPLLLGCTHPQEPPVKEVSAPPSGEGKPMAPVEIAAKLAPGHASFMVRFETKAEHVTVTVSGLDGLTVGSPSSFEGGAFEQAKSAQWEVDYTGSSGTLVVNVSGVFNGAKKSRVATFAVGDVRPISSGTKVSPDNGQPFKALPASN